MKKNLRSGYTTGACAAAAAKAATMLLIRSQELGLRSQKIINSIDIPFPDGNRVSFKVHNSELITLNSELIAKASVVKDAGDDPDVTNGAEIMAEVRIQDSGFRIQDDKNRASCIVHHESSPLLIKGGKGVGIVTKPGLPVPAGEPAINPVPRKMIREAVTEAILEQQNSRATEQQFKDEDTTALLRHATALEVTISVPDGENLAKKTLNSRLGIIGGISILGTTGIVKPVSSEAWTATIASSMDVAKAMKRDEVVLSAGRLSEKAHMGKFNLPEESYVMMGDYLEFALLEAKKHGFKKIHLCAQWAKMLKIAMSTPQTHVKHGAIDIKKTVDFLKSLGYGLWVMGYEFNTAREIFDFINSRIRTPHLVFSKVCNTAGKYAEGIAGRIPVVSHLVSYEGEIIANSE